MVHAVRTFGIGLVTFAALGCDLALQATTVDGPPQGGAAAATDEVGQRILTAYAAFDPLACPYNECARQLREAAGVTEGVNFQRQRTLANPRNHMSNPDPEWLTGWNALTQSDSPHESPRVWTAMWLAKANRVFQKRCFDEYANVHSSLLAGDARWKQLVSAAQDKPNVYQRIEALLRLRAQVAVAEPNKLVAEFAPRRLVVEEALRDAFAAAGRLYVMTDENLDTYFRQKGMPMRPRLSLEEERALYCGQAARHGTTALPLPPGSSSFGYHINLDTRHVKRLWPEGAMARFEAAEKKATTEAEERFARPRGHRSTPFWSIDDDAAKTTAAGTLVQHNNHDFKVRAVKAEGGRLVLELFSRRESEHEWGCVDTNRIIGINRDGSFRFAEVCRQGKDTADTIVLVSFDELPPGTNIQVGDSLSFHGEFKKGTRKFLAKSEARTVTRDDVVIEGKHLGELRRGGKVVGKWFARE